MVLVGEGENEVVVVRMVVVVVVMVVVVVALVGTAREPHHRPTMPFDTTHPPDLTHPLAHQRVCCGFALVCYDVCVRRWRVGLVDNGHPKTHSEATVGQ